MDQRQKEIDNLKDYKYGCSTDIESLQERNNLYYKVNSDKPFSGSILSKYESGQKK